MPAEVVLSLQASSISRSVAVRIEPHGTLRVMAGLSDEEKQIAVKIRLDGITYHPLMPFNTLPPCEPNCFPKARSEQSNMGLSGCLKYCAPTMYDSKTNKLVNCQCTMLKRRCGGMRCAHPRLVLP